jgi:hypothetical protein
VFLGPTRGPDPANPPRWYVHILMVLRK